LGKGAELSGIPVPEAGPGLPFGPEYVPLAAGSCTVVYWAPRPLPCQLPRWIA